MCKTRKRILCLVFLLGVMSGVWFCELFISDSRHSNTEKRLKNLEMRAEKSDSLMIKVLQNLNELMYEEKIWKRQ